MLVDEDQPVLGLGDDIGGGDLAARDAEREARAAAAAPSPARRGRRRGVEVGAGVANHCPSRSARGGARQLPSARASPARAAGSSAPHSRSARPHRPSAACSPAAARCGGRPRRAHGAARRRSGRACSAGSRKRTSVLAGWTLTSTSSRGNFEEQGRDRVAVAREQVLIGGADRADQQPVLHRPAVDEQILLVGDAAVEGRQADDAAQPRPSPRA